MKGAQYLLPLNSCWQTPEKKERKKERLDQR